MKKVLTVGIVASLALLSACGTKNSSQTAYDLKITNGKVIDEAVHPETVNLYRRIYENGKRKGAATCTGTWIGPNTILTAAHCTGDGPSDANGEVQGLDIVVFEVTDHTTMPKKTKLITTVQHAFRNPLWEGKKGSNSYDLAILQTATKGSSERARGQATISKTPPHKGDQIDILGYGFNNMSPFSKKGDDHKRIGHNAIAGVDSGMIRIEGELQDKNGGATGDRASAGNGDSGGPMLRQGQLIGVASEGGSGGIMTQGEASYIDLNSESSRTFLAKFGF